MLKKGSTTVLVFSRAKVKCTNLVLNWKKMSQKYAASEPLALPSELPCFGYSRKFGLDQDWHYFNLL